MIEIGQDALGRWAWLLRDKTGRVIASDDDYYEAQLALEAAIRAFNKVQPRLPL